MNDTVNQHAEPEKPEVHKIDKATTKEIIHPAQALLKDVNNEVHRGMYLKDMKFGVKKVPEKKHTHRFVDWVNEKKNSFSKMFSRFNSKK